VIGNTRKDRNVLHHQHIRTTAAIALALAAIAAPAASADAGQAGWVVRPNPDQQAAQLARAAAAARPAPTNWVVRPNPDEQYPAPAPTTIVRTTTPTDGFDWGDAGIGAAAGVALSMIGLASAVTVSQRRTRRSRGSAAVTS
jgi:hypothetical protein